MQRALRYGGALTLVILDLDDFKQINDRYGHNIGDAVLVAVCDKLAQRLRISDHLGRWGGEEFLIILPQTNDDEALLLTHNFKQILQDSAWGDLPKVTISMGIAQWHVQESLEHWVHRADQALYKSKNSGKNQATLSE